jgi:hypothetical protein
MPYYDSDIKKFKSELKVVDGSAMDYLIKYLIARKEEDKKAFYANLKKGEILDIQRFLEEAVKSPSETVAEDSKQIRLTGMDPAQGQCLAEIRDLFFEKTEVEVPNPSSADLLDATKRQAEWALKMESIANSDLLSDSSIFELDKLGPAPSNPTMTVEVPRQEETIYDIVEPQRNDRLHAEQQAKLQREAKLAEIRAQKKENASLNEKIKKRVLERKVANGTGNGNDVTARRNALNSILKEMQDEDYKDGNKVIDIDNIEAAIKARLENDPEKLKNFEKGTSQRSSSRAHRAKKMILRGFKKTEDSFAKSQYEHMKLDITALKEEAKATPGAPKPEQEQVQETQPQKRQKRRY